MKKTCFLLAWVLLVFSACASDSSGGNAVASPSGSSSPAAQSGADSSSQQNPAAELAPGLSVEFVSGAQNELAHSGGKGMHDAEIQVQDGMLYYILAQDTTAGAWHEIHRKNLGTGKDDLLRRYNAVYDASLPTTFVVTEEGNLVIRMKDGEVTLGTEYYDVRTGVATDLSEMFDLKTSVVRAMIYEQGALYLRTEEELLRIPSMDASGVEKVWEAAECTASEGNFFFEEEGTIYFVNEQTQQPVELLTLRSEFKVSISNIRVCDGVMALDFYQHSKAFYTVMLDLNNQTPVFFSDALDEKNILHENGFYRVAYEIDDSIVMVEHAFYTRMQVYDCTFGGAETEMFPSLELGSFPVWTEFAIYEDVLYYYTRESPFNQEIAYVQAV